MNLSKARLCLQCEEIHEENQCPRCTEQHYVYLVKWLNRKPPRRICAWCRRDLGPAGDGCQQDTHGICASCKAVQMRDYLGENRAWNS